MCKLAAALILLSALGPAQVVPAQSGISAEEADYRLGPGDIIQIRATEAEEISDKPIRIGADGYINLNSVGRLQAARHTVEELQAMIAEKLKVLIKEPDVTVSIVETHSQPISILGAVKTPGVIQLSGRKTLLEVMSLAGGPREDAGYTIRISRQKESGPLPLPGAMSDSTGQYIVAEANLQDIMDARDPAGNILIRPNDVINVPKADVVYVIGDVLKPGSIAISSQKTVTVLQAISIASGVGKFAKADESKILRVVPGTSSRTELIVPVKKMLQGKAGDIALQSDDILFVPNNYKKELTMRTIESLATTGIMTTLYRIP